MQPMKRKVYRSNILRHWPIAAQRDATAHVIGEVYEDVLKPRALKAHSPADLKERAELLRPTGRRRGDETIYVASLGVLAWVAEDFMACMGAASARGATVVALDTGRSIPPTANAADLAEAQSEFLAARRKQTSGDRLAGVAASKAKRMADTKTRLALIEADWHQPIVPTSELLLRAGKKRRGRIVPMAWRTAVDSLGRRPTAAKMRAAQMERQHAEA